MSEGSTGSAIRGLDFGWRRGESDFQDFWPLEIPLEQVAPEQMNDKPEYPRRIDRAASASPFVRRAETE